MYFNFGINWTQYSEQVLDQSRITQATKNLRSLLGIKTLMKKSFLDIGCGSGIHSIAAYKLGAHEIVGIDISSESVSISKKNQKRFASESKIKFSQENIFKLKTPDKKFDIVYSWGVLHHTGNMDLAIKIASRLVKPQGHLVLAIYNRHWSSPVWNQIKRLYNLSPVFIQRLMVYGFALIIAFAKFLVTGKNPFAKKRRGMNFYYDVIDWLGGYPYEYATKEEVIEMASDLGFKLKKFVKAEVPTGCHEYVFMRS
jgi:ubiquinone/menaquinone biosynthesis C-methylase UbiE